MSIKQNGIISSALRILAAKSKDRMIKIVDKRIICLIFLLVVILKIPCLGAPYFEDAKFWTVPRALYLSQHFLQFRRTNLPDELSEIEFAKRHPWLSWEVKDAGHPPLWFWMLASVYKLFGHSLFISHALVILLSGLGVCFTYLLALLITKGDRFVACAAALVLFFSPVYFSQTEVLNHSIALAAFSVIAIYFYYKGNLPAYSLIASALVLTKESGLLIVLPILAHVLIKKLQRRTSLKNLILCTAPLFVFLAWLVLHYFAVGWWFFPEHTRVLTKGIFSTRVGTFAKNFVQVISFLFLQQYRFILSGFLLVGLLKTQTRKKILTEGNIVNLAIIFVFICVFSLFSFPMRPRYFVPIYPLLITVFCVAARYTLRYKKVFIASMIFFTVLSITQWHTAKTNHPEDNLQFQDVVKTKQQAISFLKENYPEAKIWTEGFFYIDILYPYVGYKGSDLNINMLDEKFKLKEGDTKKIILKENDIVLEPSGPRYRLRKKREFFHNLDATLIKEFKIRQDYVKIYLINKNQVAGY